MDGRCVALVAILMAILMVALVACGGDRGGRDGDGDNNNGDGETLAQIGEACPGGNEALCEGGGTTTSCYEVAVGVHQCQLECDECETEADCQQDHSTGRDYCPMPTADRGEACDTDADCPAGLVCLDTNLGRVCALTCKEERDCDLDQCWPYSRDYSYCAGPDDPAFGTLGRCETEADCPGGFVCADIGGDLRCYPPCDTDADCPIRQDHSRCRPAEGDTPSLCAY